jgi:hypothetical protein
MRLSISAKTAEFRPVGVKKGSRFFGKKRPCNGFIENGLATD